MTRQMQLEEAKQIHARENEARKEMYEQQKRDREMQGNIIDLNNWSDR